jgi:hypothetical protein
MEISCDRPAEVSSEESKDRTQESGVADWDERMALNWRAAFAFPYSFLPADFFF